MGNPNAQLDSALNQLAIFEVNSANLAPQLSSGLSDLLLLSHQIAAQWGDSYIGVDYLLHAFWQKPSFPLSEAPAKT